MIAILLIIVVGCTLGYIAWAWFDWFIPRWEAHTGREWVSGDPLEPDAVFSKDGRRLL